MPPAKRPSDSSHFLLSVVLPETWEKAPRMAVNVCQFSGSVPEVVQDPPSRLLIGFKQNYKMVTSEYILNVRYSCKSQSML